MAKRTIAQNNQIHAIAGMIDLDKADLAEHVSNLTGGRTNSTSGMDVREADALIKNLRNTLKDKMPAMQRMKSKILHLCKSCFGWQLHPDSPDWNNFNNWMKKSGTHKKALNKLSHNQLSDTITQLEETLKKVDKQQFVRHVNQELADLNIKRHGRAKD